MGEEKGKVKSRKLMPQERCTSAKRTDRLRLKATWEALVY
jgi:hypothetical protein